MKTQEFLLRARLDIEALHAWIEAGWLIPDRNGEERGFSEVDLARARLIHDLKGLGVNEDGIPIVLDLVDQVHGLRRALRELLSLLHAHSQTSGRRFAAGSDQGGSPQSLSTDNRNQFPGRVGNKSQESSEWKHHRRP
jgi:chaperone modulatory protein CbpM